MQYDGELIPISVIVYNKDISYNICFIDTEFMLVFALSFLLLLIIIIYRLFIFVTTIRCTKIRNILEIVNFKLENSAILEKGAWHFCY